jgi:hypothetical protein
MDDIDIQHRTIVEIKQEFDNLERFYKSSEFLEAIELLRLNVERHGLMEDETIMFNPGHFTISINVFNKIFDALKCFKNWKRIPCARFKTEHLYYRGLEFISAKELWSVRQQPTMDTRVREFIEIITWWFKTRVWFNKWVYLWSCDNHVIPVYQCADCRKLGKWVRAAKGCRISSKWPFWKVWSKH